MAKKPDPYAVSPADKLATVGTVLSVVMVIAGFIIAKAVAPAYEIESNAFDSNTVEVMNWPLFSLWIVGAAVTLAVTNAASAICRTISK